MRLMQISAEILIKKNIIRSSILVIYQQNNKENNCILNQII